LTINQSDPLNVIRDTNAAIEIVATYPATGERKKGEPAELPQPESIDEAVIWCIPKQAQDY